MMDIQRLLRLAADFDRFRGEEWMNQGEGFDPDELSAEELDFAAAAGMPSALFGQLTEDE